MVARREPQNWQSGSSVEVAAPQFGQLSVSGCIVRILAGEFKSGLPDDACAILCGEQNVQQPMSKAQRQLRLSGGSDIGLWTLDWRPLRR